MNWLIAAMLSAFFAALTAILAKLGVKNIDSNLATAVRTTVVLIFTWIIVFLQGNMTKVAKISPQGLFFLIVSGLATALSWLFYFYALKLGKANQVVSVDKMSLIITIILSAFILQEKVTPQILLGAILMTFGAVVIALAK